MGRPIGRLVFLAILILGGGWFLGGVLNLAAIVSPPLVSMVKCPPGSTARQEFVQQSFDQPGQKTLTFQCLDQNGNNVDLLSEAESNAIQYRVFYPAGVVLMAIIVAAWFAVSRMVSGRAARADSFSS